ncbi:MAG: hypothetical protein AAGB46_04705 [Verrucomicrobiota bacterium]
MESSKKKNPHSWDEIVAAARRETPPEIDVRAFVRARIESEVRSVERASPSSIGLFDGIIELFASRAAKAAFAAACLCIAGLALQSINDIEATELIEEDAPEGVADNRSVFDAENMDFENQFYAFL